MANHCDYVMKIVGKRTNCRTFMTKLKSYDVPNHFYRIFDADIYAEEVEADGDTVSFIITGYCAWSLETCCRASGYSEGIDLFEVNTRDLDLKLEAYSRETGWELEEHYVYDKGKCITSELKDVIEYFWDEQEFPTYEAFKAEYPDAPPEEDFDPDGRTALVGGFDQYATWII